MKHAHKAVERIWTDIDKSIDDEYPREVVDGMDWGAMMRYQSHVDDLYEALVGRVAKRFDVDPEKLYFECEIAEERTERKRVEVTVPWEPWTDDAGKRHHGRVCMEAWDRGLNCQCIPESVRKDEEYRARHGLGVDPGFGPY